MIRLTEELLSKYTNLPSKHEKIIDHMLAVDYRMPDKVIEVEKKYIRTLTQLLGLDNTDYVEGLLDSQENRTLQGKGEEYLQGYKDYTELLYSEIWKSRIKSRVK
jgi:hypothetical protein